MEKRTKILAIALIVVGMLFTIFTFYFYQIYSTPNILVDKDDAYIYVRKGLTFEEFRTDLYKNKVVHDLVSFGFVAKLLDLEGEMKPGRYHFKRNMTNPEAVRMLRSGEQKPLRVTFNNIRTTEELAEKLSGKLMLEKDELLKLLEDENYVKEMGFSKETAGLMFIPNTYELYWTVKADDLVKRMKKEYDKFWNESRKAKAAEIGLSPVEVAVLASIVEAEASLSSEYPVVAGVYLNRMNRHMRLEADPTLVFAHGDFEIRRVLDKHKEIDSPYNTYKYAGLPPGPIRLPATNAIDAVLNHEKHNYIFFCAKEDFSGAHNFASNLAEHSRNARKYHRALNKARIYK
ncbi:aminodeoxychorismate lyase [Fulvitalea axinellae]|uniref:Endolytic murein transglycosylase n=1 Tax=Fulvitalea axinellae TaxID=1182444 RepID=A0AAU9CLS8_9BACT|nr:aminodeoxychorismate lyase [Fulvitalea axinellae]